MMNDFLNWPILHLVSVTNFGLLIWNVTETMKIKRDLAYMQGAFEERKLRRE